MGKLHDAGNIFTIVAGIIAVITFLTGIFRPVNSSVPTIGVESWIWFVFAGIAAAVAIILLVLHLHYDKLKPTLVVAASPKETYFKERITVHNRNDTAYSYKIRVGKTYLKWQSDIVSQGEKMIATLGPGNGSGVILDDVVYQLADHDVVIEALNWRPWPFSKVAYRRRFKDI